MANYVPPVQSTLGQIIDVIVLVLLSVGALFLPLWLGLAGGAKVDTPVENPTWESLGQNAVMVEQWNKLGFADAAAAAPMITPRYDYTINTGSLIVMAVVIIAYFVMMIRFSDIEYREVIAEKFGKK